VSVQLRHPRWRAAGAGLAAAALLGTAAGPAGAAPVPIGHAYGWGGNGFGQLGDGTTTDRPAPGRVVALPSDVRQLASGNDFRLALRSNGTLLAWGANFQGQLGEAPTRPRTKPAPVRGLPPIVQVSAGDWHVLALDADGNVWAWGGNEHGQVGDGTTAERDTPVRLTGVEHVVQVSAGARFSLAVRADGTVWSWGAGEAGELGTGGFEDSASPVPVAGLADVVQTAGAFGGQHSLALRRDGTVWGWGGNYYGQLGIGTVTDAEPRPVQALELSRVTSLVAGEGSSLAVSGGRVWTWGGNYFGQLGDGTTVNRAVPAPLALTGVTQVASGYSQSAVLRTDGSMWTWGANFRGQQGTGVPDVFTTTPARVPVPGHVVQASLDLDSDMVLSTDILTTS
jgi:alpha-tubulin suppressor-like RCC1 family protein